MTTIVAKPLGSRASAHGFPSSCAAALPFLAAAVALGNARVWVPIGAVAAIAAVAVRHDAQHAAIPDRLVALAVSIPLAIAAAAYFDGDRTWVDVATGTLIMSTPLVVLHAVDPALFGFGDVKLSVALGAALGLLDPRWGVVALALAAFASLCQLVVSNASRTPFGPGLLIGFEVAALSTAVMPGAAP